MVAIPSLLYAEPIRFAITEKFPEFRVTTDLPAQLALQFRERTSELALISPLEYAKESSLYRIIPNIAVSAHNGRGNVSLYFNQGLKTIRTLAADPNYSSEIVLALLILAEHYESHPKVIPYIGDRDSMLAVADAALVIRTGRVSENDCNDCLDVISLWNDLYELPVVVGLFACLEGAVTEKEFQILSHLGAMIDERVQQNAKAHDDVFFTDEQLEEIERNTYFASFSYRLQEHEFESLREFFRLAYYHGILKDIPEIRMYSPIQPQFSQN